MPAVPRPGAETVGVPEGGGVGGLERPGGFEQVQRVTGRARPGAGPQLEQLCGPLHVAERAAAELQVELRIVSGRDPFALDAGLHPAYLPLGGLVERRRPHRLVRQRHEASDHLLVTGNGPGAQQGLAFPGLAPALVVAREGLEAARERALAPLRAERGVYPDDPFGGCRAVAQPEQRRRRRLGRLGVRSRVPLVHDQHVEVAAVGDLRPAEAPHGDHGHRRAGCHGVQPRCDDCGAEVGQGAPGLVQVGETEQVPGRYPHGLGLAQLPESPRAPLGYLAGGDHGVADECVGVERRQGGPVVEELHEIGVPGDDLAKPSAGPEQQAEPPGDLGRLPERRHEQVAPVRGAGEGAKPDETLIGVRRLGEPVEQQGQELLHQPRRACEAPGELAQGLAGAVGVCEAECGEPFRGGTRLQAGLADGLVAVSGNRLVGPAAGEGLEQGPEEEPFVDGTSRGLMAGENGVEALTGRLHGPAPETQHPREAVPRGPVGGHRVDLCLFDQLEAVFDGAQEPVRDGERPGVLGRHVTGIGKLGEAWQRRPQPQRRIPAAVDQLQQLHGELDVPDPAAAPLELTVVEAPLGDDRFRPGLHRAQLGEVVGSEPPRPQVL